MPTVERHFVKVQPENCITCQLTRDLCVS